MYSGQNAGSDQAVAAQISGKLDQGPVLIGENHRHTRARAIIGELLEQEKIKHLFLELEGQDNDGSSSLREIASLKTPEQRKEVFARSTKDQELLTTYAYSHISNMQHPNAIKILNICRRAVKCGCNVYFHDVGRVAPGANLITRNKASADEYRKFATADGKHCLILCGADHMNSSKTGLSYTLQGLLSISEDRCFDLRNSS